MAGTSYDSRHMKHEPSTLERIWAENEGITTPEIVFADIDAVLAAEVEQAKVEHTIARRVHAMLKYVFGVCQTKADKQPTAEKATKQLGLVASQRVSEIADPQTIMEEIAVDEMFEPHVADALVNMEDALHEKKDKDLPAAKKQTLRELMTLRAELVRKAA